MKKITKKLALRTESLRNLAEAELPNVQGGAPRPTLTICGSICDSFRCG